MSTYTALAKATYKANVRDTTTIFFTFAFPLVFLVIFGLIFRGQQVAGTGHGYVDFIAPGVLSWGLASAALFGISFTLMQWRGDDLLRLIRMTPAPLRSVLGSRVVLAQAIGVLIVGSRANTPEAVAAIANCVVVPMAFLSGSFYPTELMPGWLQGISKALPLRYVNDAMGYALAGQGSFAHYLLSLGVLGGFSALFLVIGVRTFRWSNDS
jgi:ABC-2 type transport system permease protein